MLRPTDIMIGDLYYSELGIPKKITRNDFTEKPVALWQASSPIFLTGEILEKNGFKLRGGIYCKDFTMFSSAPFNSKFRMGWNPKNQILIIGYGQFPNYIVFVHELQHIFRLLDLHEVANNFQV